MPLRKPAFLRPLPLRTLATASYLILSGMSRPRIAVLCLAASRCVLGPPPSPQPGVAAGGGRWDAPGVFLGVALRKGWR